MSYIKEKNLNNIKIIRFINHQCLTQSLEPDENNVKIDLQTKPNLIYFSCKNMKLIVPLSKIINMEEL